jgi:hypothetical protein
MTDKEKPWGEIPGVSLLWVVPRSQIPEFFNNNYLKLMEVSKTWKPIHIHQDYHCTNQT